MNLQLFSRRQSKPVRVSQGQGVVVSAGTTSKTISSEPGVLERIVVNAALAGTFTITGLRDEAGNALNYVLPVSLPAGEYEIGAEFLSLSVQKSSASDDGKILLVWG